MAPPGLKLQQKFEVDETKVTYRVIGDEAVILNLDTGHYFALNDVGTDIWRLLVEQKKSLGEALEALAETYGKQVTKSRVRDDLCDIVGDLVKEGLLEEEDSK